MEKIMKSAENGDAGVSEVKFVTDNKLKTFIREIQANFKNELEETLTLGEEGGYERILEIQYIIRQYIIENQNRITFNGKMKLKDGSPLSMPSLFGLYMMVVGEVEHINTAFDVLKQVDHRFYRTMDEVVDVSGGLYYKPTTFYTDEIHNQKVCCCSHKCVIGHMGLIKNNFTNYHVVIGCDCIKKNHLIDKEVMRQEYEKTNKYLKEQAEKQAKKEEKQKIKDEIQNEKKRILLLAQDEKNKIQAEKDELKRIIREEKEIVNERKELVKELRLNNERFYIKVKYELKDEAKKMGAWWDNDKKQWFIPPRSKKTYELLEKYNK